jgi:hypothetical protein
MFDTYTEWNDSTCYYAAAFHGMHYRLLAGPYRTQAEAEAILPFAQDWALRASGDPAASSYRYAVFTSVHGHSRSILGEMKPLKPGGLTRFDGYEIGPCRRWQEDGEPVRFYYQTCEPEEADVWTEWHFHALNSGSGRTPDVRRSAAPCGGPRRPPFWA